MTIDTVYDFHQTIDIDTTHNPGNYGWLLILTIIAIVAAIALIFIDEALSLLLTVLIIVPLMVYQTHLILNDMRGDDKRFAEAVRATYEEHQPDVDETIDTWLEKHNLNRNELCNHSTVLDNSTREPIDPGQTLLCGDGELSATPGTFVLDNHAAIIHGGYDHGKIVMIYEPTDSNNTSTAKATTTTAHP
jgi:hypothetical protein